jgi:membrane protease YdiL (CAAX protease family)
LAPALFILALAAARSGAAAEAHPAEAHPAEARPVESLSAEAGSDRAEARPDPSRPESGRDDSAAAKPPSAPAAPPETLSDPADEAADRDRPRRSPSILGGAPRRDAADPGQDWPLRHKGPRFKSDLILPGASVILPGFGQYFQSDLSGLAYTAAAVAGLGVAISGLLSMDTAGLDQANVTEVPDAWSYRSFLLGTLAFQGSGFLSAYAAFRSSVPRFQEEDGEYAFLGPPEPVGGLMLSPFRMSHLAEPSAGIPLGALAGIVAYAIADGRHGHPGARWTLSGDDFLFVGAESWNAGVSEEAVFRGWIYPFLYQALGQNYWLANGGQALLFGAAHFDPKSNPVPWPQALLGFYFGWLTRKNGWTLSESIFVHAWWDMLLFTGQIATHYRDPASQAAFRLDLPIAW